MLIQFMKERNHSNVKSATKISFKVKKSFKFDKFEVYFGLKYDLNLHIASVHEGKKPFKCEICDDQFELKHELNEHIASVHEEENQSAQ